MFELLEENAGKRIDIDFQSKGNRIQRTKSGTNSAEPSSFDGLMQLQHISPECLVAKGVEPEDLPS